MTEKIDELETKVKELQAEWDNCNFHYREHEKFSKRKIDQQAQTIQQLKDHNKKQAERIAELEGHMEHHCQYRAKYCPDVPRDQE